MRLLSAKTLELKEFFNSLPPYAILSHTWGREEVTFNDLPAPQARSKIGYHKIEFACRQAEIDDYEYAWIDTCCIDKTSSAELSEAINSMFNWYRYSAVCYAYLVDVDVNTFDADFIQSRWFTRGVRHIFLAIIVVSHT